jgi:peptide deformylase
VSLRKVAIIGHPTLRRKAQNVPEAKINSPKIQALINDLVETMREDNGVGLAAPQIYEPLRIFCAECQDNQCYPDKEKFDLLIFINPRITKLSPEKELDWEGCLSIPNLHGRVPRAKTVTVEALGRKGKSFTINARGFLARVIQHELDHLNGILFPERMEDFTTLTNLVEFNRYWYPQFPKPTPV